MSSQAIKRFSRDVNGFNELPNEVFTNIATFCSLKIIFKMLLVNKEKSSLLSSRCFWDLLVVGYKIDVSAEERKEMNLDQLKGVVRRSALLNCLVLGILNSYKKEVDGTQEKLKSCLDLVRDNYSIRDIRKRMEEFSGREFAKFLKALEEADDTKTGKNYINTQVCEWSAELLSSALKIATLSKNEFHFNFLFNACVKSKKIEKKSEPYENGLMRRRKKISLEISTPPKKSQIRPPIFSPKAGVRIFPLNGNMFGGQKIGFLVFKN